MAKLVYAESDSNPSVPPPEEVNSAHVLVVYDAGTYGQGKVFEINFGDYSVNPVLSASYYHIMDDPQWTTKVSDDHVAQVARRQSSANTALLKTLTVGQNFITTTSFFNSFQFNNPGASEPCLAFLENNKVALSGLIFGVFGIRAMEYNGSNWSAAGPTYNIGNNTGTISIASLPDTNIVAVLSRSPAPPNQIRIQALSRDANDTFSPLGSILDIEENFLNGIGGAILPMSPVTSTTFIVWSELTSELITYTFAAGSWAESTPRLTVPNHGRQCRITRLKDNFIALVDSSNILKLYERSGSWVQRGSDVNIGPRTVRSITEFNRTF